MKPCTVDSVLLAALEQFEYHATNRLLLSGVARMSKLRGHSMGKLSDCT